MVGMSGGGVVGGVILAQILRRPSSRDEGKIRGIERAGVDRAMCKTYPGQCQANGKDHDQF